jgi:multimeric flavodoxin WrbA
MEVKMKVVAFNGSPRKNGNTQLIIDEIFKVLREKGIECQRVDIAHAPLRGCTACMACSGNKGRCVQDDELNVWFEKAAEADAVIIGSPTYFAGISAETKAFIDRIGLLGKFSGKLRRKPFAAVMAVRRGGAVTAFDSINHMAQINGMIIVGSTYWNFALGREKGDAAQDEEGMTNMRDLAENLAWLMDKLKEK